MSTTMSSPLALSGRLEISKDFSFEAAHYFAHKPDGHPFRRMHGHSFLGSVTLTGPADDATGWIRDLVEIGRVVDQFMIDRLDHRLLNEVEGLENPSLEALCLFIFANLRDALPGLSAVEMRRPSCGERAKFAIA